MFDQLLGKTISISLIQYKSVNLSGMEKKYRLEPAVYTHIRGGEGGLTRYKWRYERERTRTSNQCLKDGFVQPENFSVAHTTSQYDTKRMANLW